MNQETKIQRATMVALSKAGHTVFRNETGRFWTGKPIHKEADTVTLTKAMMIPVGLCVGSSDLIGIQFGTGRFFAIEIKTEKGKPTKEQLQFIQHVNQMGGIAGICTSPKDAVDLLARSDI